MATQPPPSAPLPPPPTAMTSVDELPTTTADTVPAMSKSKKLTLIPPIYFEVAGGPLRRGARRPSRRPLLRHPRFHHLPLNLEHPGGPHHGGALHRLPRQRRLRHLVRIQPGQGSAGEVTENMLKNDGVGVFYKGLSAGLLRQATYTTAHLGSFRILTNKATEANDGKPLPLYQKALCGLTAGAIGACFGSLADLALICMQADATLPAAQRRNYTNTFHALYRIVADEGVLAL